MTTKSKTFGELPVGTRFSLDYEEAGFHPMSKTPEVLVKTSNEGYEVERNRAIHGDADFDYPVRLA